MEHSKRLPSILPPEQGRTVYEWVHQRENFKKTMWNARPRQEDIHKKGPNCGPTSTNKKTTNPSKQTVARPNASQKRKRSKPHPTAIPHHFLDGNEPIREKKRENGNPNYPPSTGTTHPLCGRELRPGRPMGGGREHQGGRALSSPHGRPLSLAPVVFFRLLFF